MIHDNISNGFRVTEQTRFCDRRTDYGRQWQKQYDSPSRGGGDIINEECDDDDDDDDDVRGGILRPRHTTQHQLQ